MDLGKTFTLPNGTQYARDWDRDGWLVIKNAKTIERYNELCNQRDNEDCYKHNCFFAFGDKQFEEGKAMINAGDEKIYSAGAGLYGTKKGIAEYLNALSSYKTLIRKECDPQEVYLYEYNNHECMIAFEGDEAAYNVVVRYFGKEVADSIKRLN